MRKFILLPFMGILVLTGLIAPGGPGVCNPAEKNSLPFTIKNISNRWGAVSSESTPIITEVLIETQKISEASVSVSCTLYLNQISMFEGQPEDVTLNRGPEETVVRFTTNIDNDSASINKWWASHIKNGEKTTARIKGELTINTAQGNFILPFSWENRFHTNILEGVNLEDVQTINFGLYTLKVVSLRSEWGEVSSEYTTINHTLSIYNSSIIPGAPIVNKVEYHLFLNGIEMTEGNTGLPSIIWPEQTKKVTFTTKLADDKIKKWWVSHISSQERTNYRLKYTLFVKLFGKVLANWPKEIKNSFSTDFLGKDNV